MSAVCFGDFACGGVCVNCYPNAIADRDATITALRAEVAAVIDAMKPLDAEVTALAAERDALREQVARLVEAGDRLDGELVIAQIEAPATRYARSAWTAAKGEPR